MSVASDAPNIRAVRAEKGARRGCYVAITWKGGAESLVDLGEHLAKYQSLAPLRRDKALFRRVAVGDWGWSLHWSDAAEISADALWRLALDQGGTWLRDWRAAREMTQAEAAKALGISPRMWRYYEASTHLLPKTVKLAAIGWDAEARAA